MWNVQNCDNLRYSFAPVWVETFVPENQYFQIDHDDCCSTFGKSKKEFDYEFWWGAGESTKNASSKAKETMKEAEKPKRD